MCSLLRCRFSADHGVRTSQPTWLCILCVRVGVCVCLYVCLPVPVRPSTRLPALCLPVCLRCLSITANISKKRCVLKVLQKCLSEAKARGYCAKIGSKYLKYSGGRPCSPRHEGLSGSRVPGPHPNSGWGRQSAPAFPPSARRSRAATGVGASPMQITGHAGCAPAAPLSARRAPAHCARDRLCSEKGGGSLRQYR